MMDKSPETDLPLLPALPPAGLLIWGQSPAAQSLGSLSGRMDENTSLGGIVERIKGKPGPALAGLWGRARTQVAVAQPVGGPAARDLQLPAVLGQEALEEQKGRRGGNRAAPARSSRRPELALVCSVMTFYF